MMMANQGGMGYNNNYQSEWSPSFSGYVPATNMGYGGYGGFGGGFGGYGGGYRMW